MNKPATISVIPVLWKSVSISLDQLETPGTEEVSEEIIHTSRAGVEAAICVADSFGALTTLQTALRKNPTASHFVFVKRSALSQNRVV